jgi:outer membrane immunogenic protein
MKRFENERKMRRISVPASVSRGALFFILFSGAANAADLPSRKVPAYLPPPPPPLWTGFYIGLNAGGVFGGSNNVYTSASPFYWRGGNDWISEAALSSALASGGENVDTAGFIGGGQVGYNWQFANAFVAGIEADIQGVAGARGSTGSLGGGVPTLFPDETILSARSVSRGLDYLGTVRGRLGYLATPTLLAYVTGGLAYGGANASTGILQANTFDGAEPDVFASAGSFSDTRVGWTVGGGLEWMFLPNWSAKVEYLYYDLGEATYALSNLENVQSGGVARYRSYVQSSARFDGHIARAGVNYHFNFGQAPTVAKY